MVDIMFNMKIDPNLMVFGFHCKSLCSMVEPGQPFLLFVVMADIQEN